MQNSSLTSTMTTTRYGRLALQIELWSWEIQVRRPGNGRLPLKYWTLYSIRLNTASLMFCFLYNSQWDCINTEGWQWGMLSRSWWKGTKNRLIISSQSQNLIKKLVSRNMYFVRGLVYFFRGLVHLWAAIKTTVIVKKHLHIGFIIVINPLHRGLRAGYRYNRPSSTEYEIGDNHLSDC